MEEPVASLPISARDSTASSATEDRPRNRIQVSREKKPVSFFLNLSKKFLKSEEEVELSGLGLAVTTVITIAETLRMEEIAVIRRVETGLVETHDEAKERPVLKAKIQIWIAKGGRFHEVMYGRDAAVVRSDSTGSTKASTE
eukprot:CAMPEP_0198314672 /NCGR_PEP_ID=MMETSP1450-20131203/5219_1 /TAXON_ID=753684 ORGANISM="Madagascaria erythrocladiodes, Strain CCMP3234" /NCGR_SAMPLE_ID=MMETSP1450 /ASSEMBLY_ACC=CAM_ASM_001115 /LENGTH=141 /DNA_ID=CAMNT_0044017741 /DNA_START=161 /DNA_END=586 /DNA_ORIENTATION=+